MSFAARLLHTLTVSRSGAVLDDDGDVTTDDMGQPIVAEVTVATIRGLPQPKRVIEVAAISQAGAAIGDWTIFTLPVEIGEADTITHTAADCPVRVDLPDAVWNLTGARNAAGLSHHLELDARLVKSGGLAVSVPVEAGS